MNDCYIGIGVEAVRPMVPVTGHPCRCPYPIQVPGMRVKEEDDEDTAQLNRQQRRRKRPSR